MFYYYYFNFLINFRVMSSGNILDAEMVCSNFFSDVLLTPPTEANCSCTLLVAGQNCKRRGWKHEVGTFCCWNNTKNLWRYVMKKRVVFSIANAKADTEAQIRELYKPRPSFMDIRVHELCAVVREALLMVCDILFKRHEALGYSCLD